MTGSGLRGLAAIVALAALPALAPAAHAAGRVSVFRALSGADAASFSVPGDMSLVRRFALPALDVRYERYQQLFGSRRAEVLGGEITVYRSASGTARTVIGAHYPDIRPSNKVAISGADARRVSERDVGSSGRRITTLMIDPASGRFFYRVETRRFASRWVHWINAESGRVIRRFNAIEHNHGIGVKGDTKDINGPNNTSTADDLTTFHNAAGHGASGPHWDLFSKDNRQQTYDAKNKSTFIYYVTDLDNHWITLGRRSPGQPALVDAQYYANTTDDYFQSRFGLNWTSSCGYSAMQSVAHYKRDYDNAFWDGTYVVYGNGDGTSFREFSGGLDVVAHEHTHGVTECTSNLLSSGESGALDESFSDILGNSAEFFANEPLSSNCRLASGQTACADWWVGEDIDLTSDTVPGFRNMADPQEDGDPDHYSELVVGGDSHVNAGIPNHAYYLLVNGGHNAGCDNVGSNGHQHTADCGVNVTGIGVLDAEKIFFQGFTSLPTNATMCQARQATEAAASSLFGAGSQQKTSTGQAWDAVGLHSSCGSPPSGTPYRDAVVGTSGLVDYWRLDEGSGTTAADSKGTNTCSYANGILLAQPGALVSESDAGVRLDGVDDHVNCSPGAFGTPSSFSVEAWVKLDTQKGTSGKHTLVTDSFDDFNDGWILAVDDTNQVALSLAASSTVKVKVTSPSALSLNTWYHVVGTYDGSTSRLYVNGALVSSASYTSGVTYNASRDLLLGKQNKSFNQSIRYLDGSVDEVALYNVALLGTTVASHYSAAGY